MDNKNKQNLHHRVYHEKIDSEKFKLRQERKKLEQEKLDFEKQKNEIEKIKSELAKNNNSVFAKFKHNVKKKKPKVLNYFILNEEESKTKKNFACGLNFYKLFWVFFIGCFLGVVIEMLYCLAVEQKIESRQGLIFGPFNPVYGFGAVVITLVLYFMRNSRDLWVFVWGAVLGGAFEYLCSWYQETFLGTLSWNYEGQIGNIGGRTSIMYMLFWGILTVLWLKFIYPFMSRLIEKIPKKIGIILTWILLVFMICDMIISGLAVYRLTQRHSGHTATTQYEQFMDSTFNDDVMFLVYPNMKVSNYK